MILSPNRMLPIERYWTHSVFNLDIELRMIPTNWADILLEADYVTESDMMSKSILLEGEMLDILDWLLSYCLVENISTLDSDGPVLVGDDVNLKCPKLLYFSCFWVFLGVFGCFWMIWCWGSPVLVGGHVVAKLLYIALFTCFRVFLDLFGHI